MNARAWLTGAADTMREHRGSIEAAAIVIAITIVLLLVGSALHRRAVAFAAERARLERVGAITREWTQSFQAPSNSEQLAWRRADRELGELGLRSPTQLELIRLVSARAEEVGIPDARVRIIDAGDVALPDRSADTVVIATADYMLQLEYTALTEATHALLTVLPAALEPQRISMEAANGEVRTALVLAVYIVESHETEQDPTLGALDATAAVDRAGGARGPLGGDARAAGAGAR